MTLINRNHKIQSFIIIILIIGIIVILSTFTRQKLIFTIEQNEQILAKENIPVTIDDDGYDSSTSIITVESITPQQQQQQRISSTSLPPTKNPTITTTSYSPTYPPTNTYYNNIPIKWKNSGSSMLPSKHSNYTYVYCFSGEHLEIFQTYREFWITDTDWSKRMCLFRNLGWNGKQFLFYRDPTITVESPQGGVWGWDGALRDLPVLIPPSALLSNLFSESDRFRFIDGPFNQSSLRRQLTTSTTTNNFDDGDEPCLVLTQNTCVGYLHNPGHEISDNAMVPFSTMVYANMLSLWNTIVFIKKCRKSDLSDSIDKQVFTITNQAIWLRQLQPGTYPLVLAGDDSNRLFRKMQLTLQLGHAITFRDRTIDLMKLFYPKSFIHSTRNIKSTTIKIGIRYKKNKHAILNQKNLTEYLTQQFPQAHVSLLVFDTMTLAEEISIMNQLDVYITPSGGGSYNMIYLKNGATAIIVNPCWPGVFDEEHMNPQPIGWDQHLKWATDKASGSLVPNVNNTRLWCTRTDNYVWDTMSHFHKIYFSVDNITFPGIVDGIFEHQPSYDSPHIQLMYSYAVNMERMAKIVRGILLRIKVTYRG
jgi:hypothetical protein